MAEIFKSLDQRNYRNSTTYCIYSGIVLHNTPTILDTESSIHFAKHWLFNCTPQTIMQYHYAEKRKDHTSRSVLLLSLLLHKNVLGTKISIKFPATFPEVKLNRNYAHCMYILSKVANMQKQHRDRFLSHLPGYTSNSVISNPRNQYNSFHSEHLGSDLLRYVSETIAPAIMLSLNTFITNKSHLETESEYLNLELEYRKKRKAELGARVTTEDIFPKDKLSIPITEYWSYILQDVQTTYELNNNQLDNYKKQLTSPTSTKDLTALLSMINGLYKVSLINGHLATIPSVQFEFAASQIKSLIKELEIVQNSLDLTPINTLEVIDVSNQPDNVHTSPTIPPTNSKLSSLLSKVRKSTTAQTTKADEKLARIENKTTDFVIVSNNPEPSSLENLTAENLDLD